VKILLLNQYYAPDEAATAQVLADLGAALAKEGHSVTAVCCNRSYTDPSRRYAPRDEIDGVRIRRVRTSGFGRSTAAGRVLDYLFFVTGAILTMLRVERPDVIISLTTPPMIGLAGVFVARLRGGKAVLWSMDVYPDLLYALGAVRPGSIAGRILRLVSSATVRSQDAVVVLGESMAGYLQKAGARRVDVVHNWSDENAVRPTRSSDSKLRHEWGWDKRFVILYSGNLGLAHEFDTLLAAADRLRNDPEILFAFVGAGPRLAYVERRRDELRLGNVDIRRPVARNVLSDSLAAGDVHLITLRTGVSGLLVPSKIYGILAAGRPTLYIGPPEGEVFDILRAGRCGTCIGTGQTDALVAAIEAYRSNASLRADEGTRARGLFERQFTKGRAMAQFRAVLESL
jgi:glycosyltransferase involved in cell wall biosynthesis